MASNARYERAPTRDSFEDQQYTQAPPSYQATAVPDPEPRSENDNLPDDFKVCNRNFDRVEKKQVLISL